MWTLNRIFRMQSAHFLVDCYCFCGCCCCCAFKHVSVFLPFLRFHACCIVLYTRISFDFSHRILGLLYSVWPPSSMHSQANTRTFIIVSVFLLCCRQISILRWHEPFVELARSLALYFQGNSNVTFPPFAGCFFILLFSLATFRPFVTFRSSPTGAGMYSFFASSTLIGYRLSLFLCTTIRSRMLVIFP